MNDDMLTAEILKYAALRYGDSVGWEIIRETWGRDEVVAACRGCKDLGESIVAVAACAAEIAARHAD